MSTLIDITHNLLQVFHRTAKKYTSLMHAPRHPVEANWLKFICQNIINYEFSTISFGTHIFAEIQEICPRKSYLSYEASENFSLLQHLIHL